MARVEYEVVYAASIDVVMGALVDESFLAEYAQEIGASKWDITVNRLDSEIHTRLGLTVSTLGFPAPLSHVLPATVEVLDERTWTVINENPRRRIGTVRFYAADGKLTASADGDLVLEEGTGTRFTLTADLKLSIPDVGGFAASVVRDVILKVLDDQTIVMNRRLADKGPVE